MTKQRESKSRQARGRKPQTYDNARAKTQKIAEQPRKNAAQNKNSGAVKRTEQADSKAAATSPKKKAANVAKVRSKQAALQDAEILVSVTVKNHMDSKGGHPHIIVENIDDNHVSVGLTTKKKKGKNHPNITLERSPIKIKEGKASYVRRQGTVDSINSYVEPRNGKMTNGDFEKVKKIGEKAKNKYLSEKSKKK